MTDFSELRRRVRQQQPRPPTPPLAGLSAAEIGVLYEELYIHQEELEIQNEDLRHTRGQLEASRLAYKTLYDFAPVGYFTFDPRGRILGVNITGADQLGVARRDLLKQTFTDFIAATSQDDFYLHCRQVLARESRQSCELRLHRADGSPFEARLESHATLDEAGDEHQIQTILIDVTDRNQLQAELAAERNRLRALTERLAEVQERERQRLAQELHDQVGQNLTALSFTLSAARIQLPHSPELDTIQRHLDDSLALVEQIAELTRNLMAELRPPMLDDYGLVDSLDWYAEQFTARTGLPVEFSENVSNIRLAAAVETALFRVTQEALTNVAKHAQANQLTINLTQNDTRTRLVIADDGLGFNPHEIADESKPGPHLGLLNMAERILAVGGRCHIQSAPGQGTQVIVEVPR